jgi:hypothetical protein
MTEKRPALIHTIKEKTNAFVYSHIFFALVALLGSWALIRSRPEFAVVTMLLLFAFLFLLVVFEGYSETRVVSTGSLNIVTIVTLVLFVAAISVGATFVVAGHSPGEKTSTSTPPPIQPAPPAPSTAPAPPTPPPMPARLKIASVYQAADGCQDTGREVAVSIPNADRLDISYNGPVAGIELVETTKNGNSGYRNIAFGNGTVTFQLFAGGGGTKQNIPFVGEKCIGASGGSIGEDIYAHYK